MEQDKVQKLAEKLSLLLGDDERKTDDFSVLRLSVEKIGERLTKIEEKLEIQDAAQSSIINFQSVKNHPSQEKFQNLEELADRIINSYQNEKACPYEPTDKPCDHCAMCSSRGF